MSAAIAVVLPPGAAHASSTRSPAAARATTPTSCDASSCTTNSPWPASGVSRGLPLRTTRPSGAKVVGSAWTPAACRVCASTSRRHPQPIGSQRQRRGRIVETAPRLGRIEPVSAAPPLDQPSRVRQGRREIVELAVAVAGRPDRQRQPARARGWPAAGSRSQTRNSLLLPTLRVSCTASLTAADAGTRSRCSNWNRVSRRMTTTSASSRSSGRPA